MEFSSAHLTKNIRQGGDQMRTGTAETVASIVTFGALIAYTGNYLLLIPMIGFVLIFLAFNGDNK